MGGTMKANILLVVGAVICLGGSIAVAQQNDAAAPGKITANIDTQQVAAPISKYLYGGFIEHGGMLMYRSLWAEMIRSQILLPITSVEPPAPPRRAGGGGFRGMALRRWKPVGPDDAVTLDKDQPFVGDQSPRIALDALTAHGIVQSGIPLVNGKRYNGPASGCAARRARKVNVTLIGRGANESRPLFFHLLRNIRSSRSPLRQRPTQKAQSKSAPPARATSRGHALAYAFRQRGGIPSGHDRAVEGPSRGHVAFARRQFYF